jgi:hypothetical protein
MGTLVGKETNFELVEFLSNARAAGHRVIITSSLDKKDIERMVDLVIRRTRQEGKAIIHASNFECIEKFNLYGSLMDTKIDYTFDDRPAYYVRPAIEVRVTEPSGFNKNWRFNDAKTNEPFSFPKLTVQNGADLSPKAP